MHLFGSQKIGQTVADARIAVFGHRDLIRCCVQGSVEQIAVAYIAHQVAAGTRIETAVTMLFGRYACRGNTLR